MRVSRWKGMFFLLVALFSVIGCIPTLMPSLFQHWPAWLPGKPVTLGLDLRGGVQLSLEVGVEKFLDEHYGQTMKIIRTGLQKEKIRLDNMRTNGEKGLSFSLIKPEMRERTAEIIHKLNPKLLVEGSGAKVVVHYSADDIDEMVKRAVDQSIEVIRNRVDESGAVEPVIQSQGKNRILLQIPGFTDPEHVKKLLGETAKLSFRWVKGPAKSEKDVVPVDQEVLLTKDGGYLRVEKEERMSGEHLLTAQPGFDPEGRPIVKFEMTSEGARRFSELTQPQENHGRLLAIILDKRVISSPQIKGHIMGSGAISGGQGKAAFTTAEVQDLALMMRSGALPAPLKVAHSAQVGAGLGQDSIVVGTRATLIAIAAVAVFMFLTYSLFGGFAVVGAVLNLMMLMTAMSWMGATLTLPGVAGIALTMGMAVDANVLINERIKEELRLGRKLISAVDAGYRKAMTAIVDSNVTTLIGSSILYTLGTGPVKGFAVTTALGILISMFTAIGFTRFLVAAWLEKWRPKTIYI